MLTLPHFTPEGVVAAPPSKSAAIRLMILDALSDGQACLPAFCDDTAAARACLSRMAKDETMDCGDSAAVLRFLLPIALARNGRARLTGSWQLRRRTLSPHVETLTAHGVVFSAPTLPLTAEGKLHGGTYRVRGDAGSQFLSGLLLALPLTGEAARVELATPLVSAGYADMTVDCMRRYGVRVERDGGAYVLPGGQTYRAPESVRVEGCWSSAAALLTMGALGGCVTVTGLNPASLQPDRAITTLLSRFGARITQENGNITARHGVLRGQRIDVSGTPDLLPVLAVAAAAAQGETTFFGATHIKGKESDRLAATHDMLTALCIRSAVTPDGLTVQGGRPAGAAIATRADHRMVMAAAAAAVCANGAVTIDQPETVKKSWPTFFSDITKLGGKPYAHP